ncbi:hypothetical protein JCM14469_16840 [Desulfatiferula olefinivorans]
MDLRDYDFQARGPVALDGQWEFYRNAFWDKGHPELQNKKMLIAVPGNWGRTGTGGYGTYRLTVRARPQPVPMALHIKNIGSAFSCRVNGVTLGRAGVPGTDKQSTRPQYKPQIIRIDSESCCDMEVCIDVANFHEMNGGIWDSVSLGRESDLRDIRERRNSLEFLIFGAVFFMGLYHFWLFVLRPQSRSPFYFSMLCFLIAVRIVFTHERYVLSLWPSFDWTAFHKIEYLTFTLAVAVFFSFIHRVFPAEFNKKCHTLIVGVALGYTFFVIATPPLVYGRPLVMFQIATVIFSSYTLYVIVMAVIRNRAGAIALLIGFLVLFATVINDILHQNNVIQTRFFVPFGMFALLLSQAFVISIRFSKAFDTIEMLKDAAEGAIRAKNQFIANMSHELRTPLNGVIGMTELIRETALDDSQKEYVHIIRSSSSLLLTIVNDILDLSKIESGQLYIEHLTFDLNDVLEGVYFMLQNRAREKQIDFSYHIHPDIVTTVTGDADRLKQVLLNIAGNAVKFTEKGSVSIRLVPEEIRETFEVITFFVRDTGIGIPPDKMERLFNPFFQVDVSMSRKYGGMGLGLAISKFLVERMGGTIGLSSLPGQGTEFRITLSFPVSQPVADETPEHDTGGSFLPDVRELDERTPFHILIVEDNAANRRLAEILVKKLGHTSETVCDGSQAVAVLAEKTFDLILMDVQMPVMDGLRATQIIRDPNSSVRVHDVPIIAMTAHAMTGDREKCFSAGMDDYLTKPIKPKNLAECIAVHMVRKNGRQA